ncbi:MAG: hypothetical protein JWP70_2345 [Leifsonia sp.]|jgi:hypothetical protein|nr:hypothetical protein [Leifsonia sp.]
MGISSRKIRKQKDAELAELCRRDGHQWVTLSEPPLKNIGTDAFRLPPQQTKYCARCGANA